MIACLVVAVALLGVAVLLAGWTGLLCFVLGAVALMFLLFATATPDKPGPCERGYRG